MANLLLDTDLDHRQADDGVDSPPRGIDVSTLAALRLDENLNRVKSHGGRILVQRCRGLSGRPEYQRKTAFDLGLRKTGHFCIVDENSPSEMGKVRKIQHLLRIAKLPSYVPAGVYRMQRWRTGVTLYKQAYKNNDGAAEAVVLDGEEFFKVEITSATAAASWTSDLDLSETIVKFRSVAGEPASSAIGRIVTSENGRKESGEGFVRDIIEYASNHTDEIDFASLPYNGLTLVWEAAAARLKTSSVSHCRVSVVSESQIRPSNIIDAVTLTATDKMRKQAARVVGTISLQPVPMRDAATEA